MIAVCKSRGNALTETRLDAIPNTPVVLGSDVNDSPTGTKAQDEEDTDESAQTVAEYRISDGHSVCGRNYGRDSAEQYGAGGSLYLSRSVNGCGTRKYDAWIGVDAHGAP